MHKTVIMFCLILFFTQPLHAYTISEDGDKIYTSVQSVIFKIYEGDVSGDPTDGDTDKMTVFEFEVIGKMWSDLFENITMSYGNCDLGALILPSFENAGFNGILMDRPAETCSKDMSMTIYPELNYFSALGYFYLDRTFLNDIPNGEYDISFQIEGIPARNHGHSKLIVTNTGNTLINDPVPKGWGIDTGVSFDLNFPSLILLVNLFSIPIIRRLRNKI